MRHFYMTLIALAITVGWTLAGRSGTTGPTSVEDKVSTIAAGMNAITPKTMQNGIVLRNVRADGLTLVSQMEGVHDWRPTYTDDEMKRMMTASICARADITAVLGEGAKLRFEATKPNGETLPSLTIDHCP